MRLLDAGFIFPIFVNRKLTGILSLGRARRGLPIASDSLDQLMIVANEIGSAVEKSKIIEEKLQLERKMYENEKLSSLGRLSTSVAHEVKNPLSSIKTIVQVMREDLRKNDPLQEDLAIIVNEIDRLTKVVNQLLQFAKPSSEVKTNVKIGDVIQSTLVVLNHEAKQNNIVTHCLHNNHAIQVTIADRARGIPQESPQKILEPFYTTKQTGTGLGLSIVK